MGAADQGIDNPLTKGFLSAKIMSLEIEEKEVRRSFMKKLGQLILLLLVVASIAGASDFGPRRRPGRGGGPIRSVAEPAAIVLLGAGLVSLGIYAKRKRGKKR